MPHTLEIEISTVNMSTSQVLDLFRLSQAVVYPSGVEMTQTDLSHDICLVDVPAN